MKYMLLIHQGDHPDARIAGGVERAVRGRAEGCLSRTTRRSTRRPASRPASRWRARRRRPRPRRGRRDADHRRPLRRRKEALGGYLFFEADDLDAAIELASRIPAARLGGAIEIRPLEGVIAVLERVFRDEWGRVLAALIGFLGDFELAEEAAQEAFAIAAERWPRDGTPDNPRAWL